MNPRALPPLVKSTLLLTFVLFGLSACSYLVGSWSGAPATASKRDSLTFSHNRHIVQENVACEDCHGDMAENESLESNRMIPKEKACLECHDKTDNCKMCHQNPEQPTTLVDTRMPGLLFSHKNHLTRSLPGASDKVKCATCHADIKEATMPSANHRPAMLESCGQCHDKDFGQDNCTRCHAAGSLGGKVSDEIFDHGGDWLRRHGPAARASDTACAHCHKVDTCAACHSRSAVPIRPAQLRLDRPDSAQHHRGDFLTRHPMEAKLDSKSCATCHQVSSCTQCHERMGVGQTATLGKNGPHPSSWLLRGSGDFHGDAARRDAMSCAACHDRGAASNCVACHRIGGSGGNPHPPGWQSAQDKLTAAACTPCHQ